MKALDPATVGYMNRNNKSYNFFFEFIFHWSVYNKLHLLELNFLDVVSLSTLYGSGTRKVPPCVRYARLPPGSILSGVCLRQQTCIDSPWRKNKKKRFFSSREGVSRRRQSVQRRCSSLSCSSYLWLLLSLMVNSKETILLVSYYPHKMCKCSYYRRTIFTFHIDFRLKRKPLSLSIDVECIYWLLFWKRSSLDIICLLSGRKVAFFKTAKSPTNWG